ncbi:glutamate decarboxylase 1-like [Physcomitrium patens]|uniref:glutamate decarboxylase 1-like n=1 Tax=Physcomitrium patens TaxID=3218 RepID=UPI003CCDED19
MAPESDKLIMSSLNKNYIDIDEYFITTELQIRTSQSVDKSNERCVNMIARMFNASIEEGEQAVGVGTVG